LAACLREIWRHPGCRVWAVAPTYPLSLVIEETINEFVRPTFIKEHKVSKRQYVFQNESILEIKSAEDPERLIAFGVDFFWLDEAALVKRRAWENLITRWKAGGSSLRGWITTTPKGFNWVYDVFINPETRWEGTKVFRATSLDNPLFPREDFERAKKDLPEKFFRERFLGEFVKFSGLVYPEFSEREHVIEPFDIPSNWRWFGGIDFGYNNPFVCLWIAEHDEIYYVYDEVYQRRLTPSEYISILKSKPLLPIYYADPEAKAEIMEMRQQGLNVRSARRIPSREGRYLIASLFKQGRLKIFRRCGNLIRELQSYRYPEESEGRPQKEEPLKVDDHAPDALRYALVSHQRSSTREFVVEPEPVFQRKLAGFVETGFRRRLT
jgi:PBSX family phage terminase large subunit